MELMSKASELKQNRVEVPTFSDFSLLALYISGQAVSASGSVTIMGLAGDTLSEARGGVYKTCEKLCVLDVARLICAGVRQGFDGEPGVCELPLLQGAPHAACFCGPGCPAGLRGFPPGG